MLVLSEDYKNTIRMQPRFHGISPCKHRLPFFVPTRHEEEMEYVRKALERGETGCSGENIDAIEYAVSRHIGAKHALAVSSHTAAMHLAVKLAGDRLYVAENREGENEIPPRRDILSGRKVFCADFTSISTVNPILYEGGEPVFIDISPCDWGMDPEALELAFAVYPEVKLVVMTHPYGFPGQIPAIREICDRHDAILIEDASEAYGAWIDRNTGAGSLGDYAVLDFGFGRVLSGGTGGMLLMHDDFSEKKARKWVGVSGSAFAGAPWSRYEMVSYDYGMSNLTAGLVRGQLPYYEEAIAKKKAIYDYYAERLSEDIIYMNPVGEDTTPNYQTSCMTSESAIPFTETRTERGYHYESHHGTAAPMEIIEALEAFNIEASPVYKPMHEQPLFAGCDLVTLDGSMKQAMGQSSADWYSESSQTFKTGICLPSSMAMTRDEQEMVVEIVYACFDGAEIDRMMWA